MSDRDLMQEYSLRLQTLGEYMNDQACSMTSTGKLFVESAKFLRRAANTTCGGDMIGCRGGPKCTSDHK